MPLLDVSSLSVTYPGAVKPVVKDFDLKVREGEFVGLMGSSGSGKQRSFAQFLATSQPERASRGQSCFLARRWERTGGGVIFRLFLSLQCHR